MSILKKITTLGAALASVALVSGCSSTEVDSAEADNALSRAQDAGVIRAGIEGAYPPFNAFDENNELVGFDVDITKALADRLDVEVEFVPTPWDTIIGGLNAGRYDLVISSLTITEERAEKVDFTDPYYHTGSQIFAPEGHEITDTDDLSSVVVGVTLGTTFEEMAVERGATVSTYKSDQLAMEDLANGRLGAVITDNPVGNAIISENEYSIVEVGDRISNPAAGIAVDKGEQELLDAMNEALAEIQSDGTYEEISLEWFGTDIR